MDINPQKITLDVNREMCFQILTVKQGDRGSRFIEITLTADGIKLELANIATKTVFSASLKGVLVQNDSFDINQDNNTVKVNLSDNALANSGMLECELTAVNDKNEKVTSATFNVYVASSAKGLYHSVVDMLKGIIYTDMLQDKSVTYSKLADKVIDSSKLADGAINRIELFSLDFLTRYLSMPMSIKNVMGTITDDVYNSLTETGIYNVGSSSGEKEMLVVYKLSPAHVVQVKYLTDKVFFRGIHSSTDNEYPADEWSQWVDLTIAERSITRDKLTDSAVDSSKLADGAINRIELFSLDFLAKYLSMPMSSVNVPGVIQENTYNNITETGVYNVGSSAGEREMLVVYKLSPAHVVQVKYLTNKVFFRGIHASTDNMFPAEEWGTWTDITEDKYFRYATTFYTIEQLKGYGFQRGVTYSFFTSAEIAEKVGEGFCVGAIRPTIDSNVLELFNFSTGVSWRVNLSSGTAERLTANNAEQDFVNAGNFTSLSELKDYEFEYEKIYKLEIESDIVTDNNVTIDAGVYICRHYWSPPHIYDADCLELTLFVTNGKSWTIDLESGNGFLTDKLTDFATFKYVDSTIDNVNIQISGINTQLEGLDELLASI